MASSYEYTQAAASKCYTTHALVSVNVLPNRAKYYNYVEHGRTISDVLPPPDFDILTASADDLERYGLPARPDTQPALSEWENDYRGVQWVTPPPFIAEVPPAVQSSPPPLYPNARFAGWAALGSFTSSYATYNEPGLKPVSCPSPSIAIWSGIGANVNGTASSFGQSGTYSLPNNNHNAFGEAWVAGATSPTDFSGVLFNASAYDGMRANVNYSGGTFTGTVTDVTAHKVQGWGPWSGFNGTPNSADAFVEQLQGYDMANFGTVTFTQSQGNSTPLTNFGPVSVQNSPNATAGSINGSGGFTVTYGHC
jgi:hypothetical protein